MIQHVLLESRLQLFAAWVAAQFVVIGIWSWRRSRATNRAVWIGLAALPALMLLSTVVVTQRERLIELCNTLARHVERGAAQAIADHLSEEFDAADLNRDAFVDRIEPALKRYDIANVRLSRFVFSFDADDRATVELYASCKVRTVDTYIERVLSRWRLEFVRRAGDWSITSLEAIPTPLSPVQSLRDWIR